ncbi:uncharacterized protein LOC141670487 [Apium graveolens]|uniref:uncharacterized protein LOC141670487 n=1 Tax=Apium graveolens TaxID=4045 RepID=UPI003D7B0503
MYDSRNECSDSHISTFDFLGPINDSCDRNVAMDPCVRESQKPDKSRKLSDNEGIQFRPSKFKTGDDQHGVCSQPSWSKSPPRGPCLNKTRNSPPSLRVQAIARGQKELMEMVKAMPETLYELSLKDLVDHQNDGNEKQEGEIEKNETDKQEDKTEVDQEKSNFTVNKKAIVKKQGSVRRQGSIRRHGSVRKQQSLKKIEKKMSRNESTVSESSNKGLFLKMVFPMPFGGGNKKKVAKSKTKAKPKDNPNPYAKESTKLGNNISTNSNASDKSAKSSNHKEWWKRRYPVASDSESSGLSSNGSSGSSGSSASNDSTGSSISNKSNRKKGGLLNGCSPFYYNKNKTIVE